MQSACAPQAIILPVGSAPRSPCRAWCRDLPVRRRHAWGRRSYRQDGSARFTTPQSSKRDQPAQGEQPMPTDFLQKQPGLFRRPHHHRRRARHPDVGIDQIDPPPSAPELLRPAVLPKPLMPVGNPVSGPHQRFGAGPGRHLQRCCGSKSISWSWMAMFSACRSVARMLCMVAVLTGRRYLTPARTSRSAPARRSALLDFIPQSVNIHHVDLAAQWRCRNDPNREPSLGTTSSGVCQYVQPRAEHL